MSSRANLTAAMMDAAVTRVEAKRSFQRSVYTYRAARRGWMKRLATLDALLEMTKEAEAIASDESQMEKLRSLVGRIRKIAQDELKGLGVDQRQRLGLNLSRFHLCITGICEFSFRSTHLDAGIKFGPKLQRIHEEIERSIKEMKSSEKREPLDRTYL